MTHLCFACARALVVPRACAPRCAALLSSRRLVLLTVLVGAPQPLWRCALLPRFAALDLYLSIRRARLRRLRPQGRGRPFLRPLQISRGPSRRDSQAAGLVRSTALSTTSLPGCQLSRRPSCLFLLNPPTPGFGFERLSVTSNDIEREHMGGKEIIEYENMQTRARRCEHAQRSSTESMRSTHGAMGHRARHFRG